MPKNQVKNLLTNGRFKVIQEQKVKTYICFIFLKLIFMDLRNCKSIKEYGDKHELYISVDDLIEIYQKNLDSLNNKEYVNNDTIIDDLRVFKLIVNE